MGKRKQTSIPHASGGQNDPQDSIVFLQQIRHLLLGLNWFFRPTLAPYPPSNQRTMEDSPFWTYFENFLSEEADYLFKRCEKEIPFQQWTYERDGKVGNSPRLSKFYKWDCAEKGEIIHSDDDVSASSRDVGHTGVPSIIGELAGIMNALMREEEFLQAYNIIPRIQFDSVLVHYYRTGLDYISDHNDKEAGQTYIFGLSLGAERTLRFKCKKDKSVQFSYKLKSGSLYVMRPGCQELFTHGIPKIVAKNQPGPRISLTFRHDNKPSNYNDK